MVQQTNVKTGVGISLLGGLRKIRMHGLLVVPGNTMTRMINVACPKLNIVMFCNRSFQIPLQGFLVILGNALALLAQHAHSVPET